MPWFLGKSFVGDLQCWLGLAWIFFYEENSRRMLGWDVANAMQCRPPQSICVVEDCKVQIEEEENGTAERVCELGDYGYMLYGDEWDNWEWMEMS
jgi:hypothetical protein